MWIQEEHEQKNRAVEGRCEWKVIPKALRKEVLRIVHESTHPGIGKTLTILENLNYRWPRMYTDIKKFVLSCQSCATGKRGLFMPKSKMENMEVPSCPSEQLSIDVIGPLTTTPRGNTYILTIQDIFSGFVWLIPLQEQTSQQIAEKLMEVFSFIGIPAKMVTDLGQNLISSVIKDMCSMLGITHFKTMAYVHKSNRVERTHRVVGDMMRTMLKESEIGEWDKYLSVMQMYLRSQPTVNNPFAPAEIMFGRNIRTPTLAQVEAFERQESSGVSEYVDELRQRLKLIINAQEQCRKLNNEEVKERYNQTVRPFQVRKDMLVYLKNDSKRVGISQKLQKEFLGPYKVVEVLSDHSVRLRNQANQKILKHPVHIDRIKPVVERKEEEDKDNESGTFQEEEPNAGRTPFSTEEPLGDRHGRKMGTGVINPNPDSHQGKERGTGVINPNPDSRTSDSKVVETGTKSTLKSTDSVAMVPTAVLGPASCSGGKQVSVGTKVTDNVFEIERIVETKGSGNSKMYLVKWKRSPTEKFRNSWVAASDVTQAAKDKYHERKTVSGKTRVAYRRTLKHT